MRRWLMLSLGLGITAAAFYAVLTGPWSDRPAGTSTRAQSAPLEEIDAASRAGLKKILREEDRPQ